MSTIDLNRFPFNGIELTGRWHIVFADPEMHGMHAYSTQVEDGRTVAPVDARVARHFVAALGAGVRACYSDDALPEGMPSILGELPDEEALELYETALSRWFHRQPEDHPIRSLDDPSADIVGKVVPEVVFDAFKAAKEIQDRVTARGRAAAKAEQDRLDAEEKAELDRLLAEEEAEHAAAEAAAKAKADADAARALEEAEAAALRATIQPDLDAAAAGEPKFEDPKPEDTARQMTAAEVEALDVDGAYALASELGVDIPVSGARRSKARAIDVLLASGKLRVEG